MVIDEFETKVNFEQFWLLTQAIPATVILPIIQNVARALNMKPRLDFDWNSAKYDQTRGMLICKINLV